MKVRSLAHRLRVIEGNGIEVLRKYPTATAYAAPLPYARQASQIEKDKWYLDQRILLDTLALREGPWILDYHASSDFWWSEPFDGFDRIGALWRVPLTLAKFPCSHNAILVSNPEFAWDRHKLLPQRFRVMCVEERFEECEQRLDHEEESHHGEADSMNASRIR